MTGFRGPTAYAGIAGADLENAPAGPVPFTSPFGLPVGRPNIWSPGGTMPGAGNDGVPGVEIARASGNPDISTDPAVAPPKRPYGVPRPLQQSQESDVRAPGNAPVGYSNDKLVTYDRHAIAKVGYENSGRDSGQTDPPSDGPARPSYMLLQRSLNYQQGTDTTGATDDLSRDYTRNADGMYVGEQGTGWSPVYGGVPGLWQEYGSYEGISPSSPRGEGIHSLAGQGQAGDGPASVWSGPPHGLHSPTLPAYRQTLGRYMDIPQMARPRIDRPFQSPIAGQSYSQTVQSQGQTGHATATQKAGGASYNQRARGNGWRGRAG